MMQTPDFPAGLLEAIASPTAAQRGVLIEALARVPVRFREAVEGLDEAALDTRYRRWTVRQIVHHVADSHAHAMLRFKLALTEDRPAIKAYDEDATVGLSDSAGGDVESALRMIEGLHGRWVVLLRGLEEADFARAFVHPEHGREISLNENLSYYPWHGAHHAAQISWLRERHGW